MDQRGNGFVAGLSTRIDVQVEDLAFVIGEAIAWPVTSALTAPTPLLRRLEQAAGPALTSQLTTRDPLPIGSAVVTGAGALPVGLLISAVVLSDDEPVTSSGVRRALTSALQRASDWGVQSLHITPFGLGAGNFDVDDAAEIMVAVLREHAQRAVPPTAITIVVETDLEASVFDAALSRSGA